MNVLLFSQGRYLPLFVLFISNPLDGSVYRDSLITPQVSGQKIYGHQLFREGSWPGEWTAGTIPSEEYLLGPGDKISIQILGRSQTGFVFVIDKDGFISPELMPKIFLSGLTFFQAKNMLTAHFSRFYLFSSGQFLVSLVPTGKIRIYVLGNVQKEGLYELPAFSNMFQAIASAGGPTDIASIRNIRVIHGSVSREIDAYTTSFDPKGKTPEILYDFDIVHLPVAKIQVSLSGAIQRPMKYEVGEKECLGEIIAFGGGLTPSANRQYAALYRYSEFERKQTEISLTPLLRGNTCFTLQHGDSLVFKEIKESSPQLVTIKGAVLFPGDYGLDSSGTVLKLLNKAILSDFASREQFTLLRKDEKRAIGIRKISMKAEDGFSDFPLVSGDEIILDYKEKFREEFTLEVAGKVNAPFIRSFPPGNQMLVSEAIFLAGGLSSGASHIAYIFRNNPNTPNQTVYRTVDIDSVLKHPRSPLDLWLETGDKLLLPDKTYIDFPTEVGIYGAVKYPREFKFHPSLKLQDVFRLSGGFQEGADLEHIEIYRNSRVGNLPKLTKIITRIGDSLSRDLSQNHVSLLPGDIIVVRNKMDVHPAKSIYLFGRIPNNGIYFTDKYPFFLSDLWKEAGGSALDSTFLFGKLIRSNSGRHEQKFNLPLALQFPGDLRFDIILEDRDTVFIGEINNMIFLEVPDYRLLGMDTSMKYLALPYQGHFGVKWYLSQYGGSILTSKVEGMVTVSNVSGRVKSASLKQLERWDLKIFPGDTIKVSILSKPVAQSKSPIDWGKITDRILGITTTLSLFLVYLNR
jgi:protein involved in polysaccharide export with SLBB domain